MIISSKHPRAQFYSAEEAAVLVNEGLKIIDWASTAKEEEPELVIAAAGTESNLEALAAVTLLLEEFPKLKIRFINVVDLLKLRHPSQDPRGLSDEEFDQYFTKDKPILFAFHGYETLVRTIFFDRHNHHLMIHGYKENGDITTPFDMRVVNELDRYHLAKDAALKIKGSQAEDFAEKWIRNYKNIKTIFVKMVLICQKYWIGNGKILTNKMIKSIPQNRIFTLYYLSN